MLLIKRKKGSITVFLCIIMTAIILIGGVLADITRIKCATTVTEDVTVAVSRSLMSLYNQPLQKFYGILGLQVGDGAKKSIRELLEQNIKVEEGADIFNLQVENLDIQPKGSLSDNASMLRQITSHCADDMADEWISEKMEGFSILGDLYKNKDLIGSLLPSPAEGDAADFAKINDSIKESGALGKAVSGVAEQLLLNEYILRHFSCYTGGTNKASMQSDEAEYILTGFDDENARKVSVIALLTGTRFALNLGFFVTNPVMMQKALTYAIAAAGWSGIGVPFAEAAIIVTWSLAESAIDVQQLLSGNAVPLVKNNLTWVLSETGLIDAAKNEVLKRTQEAAGNVIDDSFDSVETIVTNAISNVEADIEGQLNQLIDKLAKPLESEIKELSGKTLEAAQNALNECFQEVENCVEGFNGDGIVFETLKMYAQDWVTEIKDRIETELENVISTPDKIIAKYKRLLVEKLSEPLSLLKEKFIAEIKNASKKGRDFLKGKLANLFSGFADKASGNTSGLSAANFKSGFITMRYKDYLRLYLLTVSESLKFQRVQKLIQNNIRAISNDNSFEFGSLSTGARLDLSLSTNYFLTPISIIPDSYKTQDGKRHLIHRTCSINYLTGGR